MLRAAPRSEIRAGGFGLRYPARFDQTFGEKRSQAISDRTDRRLRQAERPFDPFRDFERGQNAGAEFQYDGRGRVEKMDGVFGLVIDDVAIHHFVLIEAPGLAVAIVFSNHALRSFQGSSPAACVQQSRKSWDDNVAQILRGDGTVPELPPPVTLAGIRKRIGAGGYEVRRTLAYPPPGLPPRKQSGRGLGACNRGNAKSCRLENLDARAATRLHRRDQQTGPSVDFSEIVDKAKDANVRMPSQRAYSRGRVRPGDRKPTTAESRPEPRHDRPGKPQDAIGVWLIAQRTNKENAAAVFDTGRLARNLYRIRNGFEPHFRMASCQIF